MPVHPQNRAFGGFQSQYKEQYQRDTQKALPFPETRYWSHAIEAETVSGRLVACKNEVLTA